MTVGNVENGLEHGFVKHCLNYVLIIDPKTLKNSVTYLCKDELANVFDPNKPWSYKTQRRGKELIDSLLKVQKRKTKANQIRRTEKGNLKAAILGVKRKKITGDLQIDFNDGNLELLKGAKYDIVFTHPQAFISCKEGMELFQSKPYQSSVQVLVIDEAHCILEWGDDFREDYSRLAMLCSTFLLVPVIALTATASKEDVIAIKESLNLKSPLKIIGNPNRPNIFYEKVFRKGEDIDFYDELLQPIACGLTKSTVEYPLTILYLPLKWCGFSYKYFVSQQKQYYPSNAASLPENRLFAQYHAPQTSTMKDQILTELASPTSKVRVLFATITMEMGVDIPSIRHIFHVGPQRTVREYFQETGRAGGDGKLSTAVLYYNNCDIATNREGMTDDITTFCKLYNACCGNFC
ncbi:putative ATP-dependent DNA helicase Q1 [Montipora capricornis]|uniref:putative ATP-dependent DNA helicase Q1 n=1 Tax=Montipora capricornis TaxID=246305 RepID=UPI0035F218E4